jgi:hypothetical protein
VLIASFSTDSRPIQEGLRRRGGTLSIILTIQELALFLFALFLGNPSRDTAGQMAVASVEGDTRPVPADWVPTLPTDLRPEQLPRPQFQEPNPIAEQTQEAPSPKGRDDVSNFDHEATRSNLFALRVSSVSYQAPVAAQVAPSAPDAPSFLTPGRISMAGFSVRNGTRVKSGQGGRGIGGTGRGIGGSGIGIGGGGRGSGNCGRGSGGRFRTIERAPVLLPN